MATIKGCQPGDPDTFVMVLCVLCIIIDIDLHTVIYLLYVDNKYLFHIT